MATPRRRGLTFVPLAFLAACGPPDAGSLGTFTVTETLVANTCGPQLPFMSAAAYTVQVSLGGGLFRWTLTGGSEVDGTYDPNTGAFRVEQDSSTQVVTPDPGHQIAGCVIDQTQVLLGIVGMSTPDGGIQPIVDAGGSALDAGFGDQDAGLQGMDAAPVFTPRAVFTGTDQIIYAGETTGDCTSVVGGSPNEYATLPCTVTYTLSGVLQ